MTTLCATFLGWRFGLAHSQASPNGAFTATFLLLCALHAMLFAAALRLPLSIHTAAEQVPAEKPPAILEMMTEAGH